jgi:hypothetical protein
MNLLVLDATQPHVSFGVFSTFPFLEEVLTGTFQCDSDQPLSVKDASGRELATFKVPPGLGDEACLAWMLQWLDNRNIRIDALAHRVTFGEQRAGGGHDRAISFLSSAYPGRPQVACLVQDDGLANLAIEAMASLALPLLESLALPRLAARGPRSIVAIARHSAA